MNGGTKTASYILSFHTILTLATLSSSAEREQKTDLISDLHVNLLT